jgi:hypothetical protein
MGFPQLKSLRLGRVFCGKLTCNAGGHLSGDKNTHKTQRSTDTNKRHANKDTE